MAPPTPALRPLIVLATLLIALVVGLQGAVATITGVTHAAAGHDAGHSIQPPSTADVSATAQAAMDGSVTASLPDHGPVHGSPAGRHHHQGDHTPAAASQPIQLTRNPQAYAKADFWEPAPRLLTTQPARMKRPPRADLPRTA